jgi:hypothetical protein
MVYSQTERVLSLDHQFASKLSADLCEAISNAYTENEVPNKATCNYVTCKVACGNTQWRSWLKHYATSRNVAASSTDEVDFFTLPTPSSRTMVLGSTQPLTPIPVA